MVDVFSGGYYGYSMEGFRSVIAQWSQFGVFDILLPLILIFAVVFAILEKINIFKNRGVNLLIAMVVGFFTISNPYVSGFFMYLFSNLGLGIAIMLALIILLGVALKPDEATWKWVFGIVGGIIFLIVLAKSGAFQVLLGDQFVFWLQQNSAFSILIVFVILAVIAVLTGFKKEQTAVGTIMPPAH